MATPDDDFADDNLDDTLERLSDAEKKRANIAFAQKRSRDEWQLNNLCLERALGTGEHAVGWAQAFALLELGRTADALVDLLLDHFQMTEAIASDNAEANAAAARALLEDDDDEPLPH